MTRVVRWAIVALGIFGLVLVSSCGSRQPTPPSGLNDVQMAGWQAYRDLNCASCHGEDRRGQRSGPALTELTDHWTADRLVSYFNDPSAVVKTDPRLRRLTERYVIGMPSASAKAPGYAEKARAEKLAALADYLLVDVRRSEE